MKKVVLVSAILFLALSPLACYKNYHVAALPAKAFTPTPTATLTPVCGYSVAPVSNPLTPFPTVEVFWKPVTPTPTWNDGPVTGFGSGTTFPPMTPTPSVIETHDLFTGTVIRTLADWQTYYGSATPPVDFNTLMLLIYVENRCCLGGQTITSVCETSDEVQLTITIIPAINCWAICLEYGAVAVPQSDLPVYVTQIIQPYSH